MHLNSVDHLHLIFLDCITLLKNYEAPCYALSPFSYRIF